MLAGCCLASPATAQENAPNWRIENGTLFRGDKPVVLKYTWGGRGMKPKDRVAELIREAGFQSRDLFRPIHTRLRSDGSVGDFGVNPNSYTDGLNYTVRLNVGRMIPSDSWMAKQHPETILRARDGSKPLYWPPQKYHMPNLFHPLTRKWVEKSIRAMARTHGDNPHFLAFVPDDEWHYRTRTPDYSPLSRRKFRTWLKDRYGSLSELNRTWGTDNNSWEDVKAPPLDERSPRFADWIYFTAEAFAKFNKFMRDTLREVDSNGLVLTNYGFYYSEKPGRNPAVWESARHWDILARKGGGPLTQAISRHYNREKVTLTGAGYGATEKIPHQIMRGIFRGAKGYYYFTAHGKETGYIRKKEGEFKTDPKRFPLLKTTNKLLDRISGDLARTSPPDPQVAVLFTDMTAKLGTRFSDDVKATFRCLNKIGVPFDLVSEHKLDRISDYDVILAGRGARFGPEALGEKLRQFVKQGGKLIITHPAFTRNRKFRKVGPLGFGLDQVLGVSLRKQTGNTQVRFAGGNLTLPVYSKYARLRGKQGQLVARYPDGSAGVVRTRNGSLVFGFPWGKVYSTLPGEKKLKFEQFLLETLRTMGVSRPVTVEEGSPALTARQLEARVLEADDFYLVGLFNPTWKESRTMLHINCLRPETQYELQDLGTKQTINGPGGDSWTGAELAEGVRVNVRSKNMFIGKVQPVSESEDGESARPPIDGRIHEVELSPPEEQEMVSVTDRTVEIENGVYGTRVTLQGKGGNLSPRLKHPTRVDFGEGDSAFFQIPAQPEVNVVRNDSAAARVVLTQESDKGYTLKKEFRFFRDVPFLFCRVTLIPEKPLDKVGLSAFTHFRNPERDIESNHLVSLRPEGKSKTVKGATGGSVPLPPNSAYLLWGPRGRKHGLGGLMGEHGGSVMMKEGRSWSRFYLSVKDARPDDRHTWEHAFYLPGKKADPGRLRAYHNALTPEGNLKIKKKTRTKRVTRAGKVLEKRTLGIVFVRRDGNESIMLPIRVELGGLQTDGMEVLVNDRPALKGAEELPAERWSVRDGELTAVTEVRGRTYLIVSARRTTSDPSERNIDQDE